MIATSAGQGDERPQSPPARDEAALASGMPRWERRFTPSTSITDVATLGEHAQAELARRRLGGRFFEITARWDAYPQYGVDWRRGDDVSWDQVGHRRPDGVVG